MFSCFGIALTHKRKKGQKTPKTITLHEYYTRKTTEIQALLAIFTIFVNYAYFYVNIIM